MTVINTIAARLQAHSDLEARIKPPSEYDWFHSKGRITVETTKGPVTLERGDKFGVRPSSNGKHVRFVMDDGHGVNKVMTISLDDAKRLAKMVDKGRAPRS